MKPEVSIVLVTWNGWSDTAACLTSLLEVNYDNFHVILVDNGSTDGTQEKIRDWCRDHWVPLVLMDGPTGTILDRNEHDSPRVIKKLYFLQNDRNLGFTGGNNQGLALGLDRGSDFILLLNNDTLATPSFLSRMVDTAQKNTDIGLLGCKILYAQPEDGRYSIWSAGEEKRLYGNFRAVGQDAFDGPQFSGLQETYYVCGCCLMIKKQVAERIGLLDDFFFFLAEDLEYSLRARRFGWKTKVDLDAVIYHQVGKGMAGRDALKIYYYTRNVAQARKKHYELKNSLLFWLGHPLHHVAVLGVRRFLAGRPRESLASFFGFIDFLRGRGGPCQHGFIANHVKKSGPAS